jgi:hypothetical protein
MSLIALIIVLALVGLVLWLINGLEFIDAKIKRIINIVALIVVILWLLYVFGLIDELKSVRVPKI